MATWKWITVALLGYTFLGGLLFEVPRLNILEESIRNLHFHVPLWFGMLALFGYSVFLSFKALGKGNIYEYDRKAEAAIEVGILFGLLGLVTGMIWANYTWGEPWSNDPKQNASAYCLLIYITYMILRQALPTGIKRVRISAVYNVFAFAIAIPLIFVLPRLTDSLHPGNGGNPGFNSYDLDNRLRIVFYPAILAWAMLGFWIYDLRYRIKNLERIND